MLDRNSCLCNSVMYGIPAHGRIRGYWKRPNCCHSTKAQIYHSACSVRITMAPVINAAQMTKSRRTLRLIWFAIVSLTFARFAQNPSKWQISSWFFTSTEPSVGLRQGKFVGTVLNDAFPQNIEAFLGIPYAQPPIGSRRFRPAVPVNNSTTVFNATKFGPSCPAKRLERPGWPRLNHSEDCLTANVFRPVSASAKSNLPVAIYVHGGLYNLGSG